jgi:hypothetical protein
VGAGDVRWIEKWGTAFWKIVRKASTLGGVPRGGLSDFGLTWLLVYAFSALLNQSEYPAAHRAAPDVRVQLDLEVYAFAVGTVFQRHHLFLLVESRRFLGPSSVGCWRLPHVGHITWALWSAICFRKVVNVSPQRLHKTSMVSTPIVDD